MPEGCEYTTEYNQPPRMPLPHVQEAGSTFVPSCLEMSAAKLPLLREVRMQRFLCKVSNFQMNRKRMYFKTRSGQSCSFQLQIPRLELPWEFKAREH